MRWKRQTIVPHILAVLLLLHVGDEAGVSAQPAARLPSAAELEGMAAPVLAGKWATGFVVGLYDHGATVVRGFGKCSDNPAPGKIVFEIGSVTKTFTALYLAEAVLRGRVKLDDPVARHVSYRIPDYNDKPIRFLDLATHTSGLPGMPPNFYPNDPENPYNGYGREKYLDFLKGYQLTRAPGAQFEYSNFGMSLAGTVVSDLDGESYETGVVERICRPLALGDTRVTLTESMKGRLTPGHDEELRPKRNWDFQFFAGGGALRSTADDMLAYLGAQLHPQKTPLAEAITLSQKVHFRQSKTSANGLGWLIGTDADFTVYDHAGQTGGYSSYATFSPERDFAVIVLTDAASPAAIGLGSALTRRMLTGKPTETPLPVAIDLPPEQLDRCTGLYRWDAANATEIVRKGDGLYLMDGESPLRLFPQSPTRFFLRKVPVLPLYFEFVLGPDGRAVSLVADPDGEKTRAPLEAKPRR